MAMNDTTRYAQGIVLAVLLHKKASIASDSNRMIVHMARHQSYRGTGTVWGRTAGETGGQVADEFHLSLLTMRCIRSSEKVDGSFIWRAFNL